MMSRIANWPLVLLSLPAITALSMPASAQDGEGDLSDLTCKEVMILSGSDRDTTIAFIHGYLVGKHGETTVDLDKLTDATEAFLNKCLDEPGAGAISTMESVANR